MTESHQLASILLSGFLEEDKHGRLRTKYLVKNGAEEHQARRELAMLVRTNQLNDQEREELASLIDPDQDAPGWQQRRIEIIQRGHVKAGGGNNGDALTNDPDRRGKLIDHVANSQVVTHVVDEIIAGLGDNGAISSAAVKFSISDEMVKRIWRRYQRAFGVDIFLVA
jgi:hypothetical protein